MEKRLLRTLFTTRINRLISIVLCSCIALLCGCTKEIPLNRIDDKYRTFYEVFVYSFYDSNNDGIGDINGLIEKLDYINDGDDKTDTDLSFDGIWLMPIMPSTTYHKYDIVDYMAIDEQYGTMDDFDNLIEECNKRGIRVIIDLVLNHTSSKHKWFIEATDYVRTCYNNKTEPNEAENEYFGYYNFSKEKKSGYCPVAGTDWFYEGKFWSEMPDLNLANDKVRQQISEIVDFWFEHGVAGFRLDAVKEFYSGSDQKSIDVLTWFNDMVKSKNPDSYLVGEAWTNQDTIAKYYESGVDSFFNFSFADKDGIIARTAKVSNETGNALTYAENIVRNQEKIQASNPEGIDAPFFTNHDMARAAGYFFGDTGESELKMAAAMNLLMPGCAFVYYGEEIGMKGTGKDENKRVAMYWTQDLEAEGMCDGPMAREKFDMKYEPLDIQADNPDSIYNFFKATIKLRNQNPEIARGITEVMEESTEEMCVMRRTYNDSQILILMNVSDSEQQIDLSNIQLNGRNAANAEIRGWLYAGTGEGSMKTNTAMLPAFSVFVLK